MRNDSQRRDTGRPNLRSLWFGLLAGPVAWAVQLPLVYTLAVWSCDRVGFAWLHVVSILCLVAAGLGAWVSSVNLRSLAEPGQASPDARRLMSLLGVMTGALFAIVVLCSWYAVFLLSPCPA
ncbi:MAG: hypothetical protein ACM3PF_04400 [Bacteroidota bacterium]